MGHREGTADSVDTTDSVPVKDGSEVGVHPSTLPVWVGVGEVLGDCEGTMVREDRDQAPRVTVGVPSPRGVGVERRGEEGVAVDDASDEGEE